MVRDSGRWMVGLGSEEGGGDGGKEGVGRRRERSELSGRRRRMRCWGRGFQ